MSKISERAMRPRPGTNRAPTAQRGQGSDTARIKTMLQDRLSTLVPELCPGERYRAGNYWFVTNPTRNDKHAGSMWIVWRGEANAIGAWKDHATDDKGDIIKLVAYCKGFQDHWQTFSWCRDWLGLEKMSEADRKAADKVSAQRAARAEKAESQARVSDRKRAFRMWLDAKRLPGTLAATYLANRGIDVTALPREPGALRFASSLRHVESDRAWPCMVSLMTSYARDGAQQASVAVHRTFLALDGSGKAPVEPTKKIWPRGWMGAVVPVARGQSDLPLKEACKHGVADTLCIAEGIEDALSIALARPDWRVWAGGTLGNLAKLTMPACATTVIVAADNDWSKPQARTLFDRGIAHLARQVDDVRVARSLVGKDFNDALCPEGIQQRNTAVEVEAGHTERRVPSVSGSDRDPAPGAAPAEGQAAPAAEAARERKETHEN